MQLYWHTKKKSYLPLATIPENHICVLPDRADALVQGFLRFSQRKTVSDDAQAAGIDGDRLYLGELEGVQCIAIHAADGTAMAIVEDIEIALELANENDMTFVAVH